MKAPAATTRGASRATRPTGRKKTADPNTSQTRNRKAKRPWAGPTRSPRAQSKVVAQSGALTVTELAELEQLRAELQRTVATAAPMRWNADPDDVQRSVAQLVLTLVEFIRQLLERQAIRRMDAGTLTAEQTEDVGRALMKLEETVRDIAAKFGIPIDELNLDLGPVGKLL